MKETEEPRKSDACCSPEWLYGTASSAPRRTSLQLRRPNTPKKRLRVPAWTLKNGGRGAAGGPTVISAKTGMRREGGRSAEIKAAGSIFSVKEMEEGE